LKVTNNPELRSKSIGRESKKCWRFVSGKSPERSSYLFSVQRFCVFLFGMESSTKSVGGNADSKIGNEPVKNFLFFSRGMLYVRADQWRALIQLDNLVRVVEKQYPATIYRYIDS